MLGLLSSPREKAALALTEQRTGQVPAHASPEEATRALLPPPPPPSATVSSASSGDEAASEDVTTCIPFGGVFDSWEAIEETFAQTSNSITDRNRSRSRQAQQSGSQPILWDESLGNYTKSWVCTHGGSFQSRRAGTRTNHTTRRIECPAKLNALLFQDAGGVFRVGGKTQVHTHSHQVDANVFNTYPEEVPRGRRSSIT
ncbi:hypothetical protein F441_17551 [Phytophthora nicotianae CJ01A1]|uniref:Uncharacterized protein n=2 Tax=Phytophthora nicotianae TaxID=4792 RepID=W2MKU6_PHYNI|nr:hypothetical protein L915_17215 [Phytophthora nicotianae]ETL29814.1 hypothetical protein L916_17106 [Phytophthora nicotianae]ETM36263.1 hypothetical protein L914_17015 [Phytophthora nicotianae]ETP05940.1 hypothetical protein F441_17551 [Phytophthora nicotianae CJ01A1]